MDTIYPDQDGVVHLKYDEFGWDWFKTNDPSTKAIYAIMQMEGYDEYIEKVKNIIKRHTGAKSIVIHPNGGYFEHGYIDHQSRGCMNNVFDNDKDIRNFIFNKNAWLFGGNDNSEPDPMFYVVDEYKSNNTIVKRLAQFTVVIPKIVCNRNVINFEKAPNHTDVEKGFYYFFEGKYIEKHQDEYYLVDDDTWPHNKYTFGLVEYNEGNQSGKVYFHKDDYGRVYKIEELNKDNICFEFSIQKISK